MGYLLIWNEFVYLFYITFGSVPLKTSGNLPFKVICTSKILICCQFLEILLYLKIVLKRKFEIQFFKKGNFTRSRKHLKKHWSLCLNVSVKNVVWRKIILYFINRYVSSKNINHLSYNLFHKQLILAHLCVILSIIFF